MQNVCKHCCIVYSTIYSTLDREEWSQLTKLSSFLMIDLSEASLLSILPAENDTTSTDLAVKVPSHTVSRFCHRTGIELDPKRGIEHMSDARKLPVFEKKSENEIHCLSGAFLCSIFHVHDGVGDCS